MKVQEIKFENNKKRYLLMDNDGLPIIPVAKYLKFLDNTERSPNTLKSYCYDLKLYFEYLDEINTDYRKVNINILANFVWWLRKDHKSYKIVNIKPTVSRRSESTINHAITVVTNFYDYLYRLEEMENDMIKKVIKTVFSGGRKSYKGFLHHISKDKPTNKNILKLKEPRRKLKVLSKDEVNEVLQATTNIRDLFLLQLLFETGLRIGETLSLFIEDFIYDYNRGHRIRLKDRGELINGALQKTGGREIFVSQELMNLFDDYEYAVLDELDIDTNFVFVKIKGKNKGRPLEYQDVNSLFKRLKKKTQINIHPHLLRHTHATMYYSQTKDIKQVQERLGHSQIQTTINLYLHPSDEEIRKNWELAQHVFERRKEAKDE